MDFSECNMGWIIITCIILFLLLVMFLWRLSKRKSQKSNCAIAHSNNEREHLGPDYMLYHKRDILGKFIP